MKSLLPVVIPPSPRRLSKRWRYMLTFGAGGFIIGAVSGVYALTIAGDAPLLAKLAGSASSIAVFTFMGAMWGHLEATAEPQPDWAAHRRAQPTVAKFKVVRKARSYRDDPAWRALPWWRKYRLAWSWEHAIVGGLLGLLGALAAIADHGH